MLTVMSVRFDFNSHPREGGDPRAGRGPAYQRISIPTPVKGVTFPRSVPSSNFQQISIPTPVKGVTAEASKISGKKFISIPTPVKGVTFGLVTLFLLGIFQFPPP